MGIENNGKESFRLKTTILIRTILGSIIRLYLTWYYRGKREKIPPIKDSILKEPAVVVARKIRNKEITSIEVLESCIKRIKETQTLNCVVADRFEDAYKEARAADELISSGTMTVQQLEEIKPFLGVPFSTKDSIAVSGLPQTAGMVDRKGYVSSRDADAIRLLKESGAIIFALTNVPEQCLWMESHNHLYGKTKNPHNTTRHAGGSSGGEGCVQAIGGSIFGIGSDYAGSIRMPAFYNGIFGHRPTSGIVSNNGQFPPTDTEMQDLMLVIGPMTKYAVDLKPIMKIISGDNVNKLNLDKPVDLSKLKLYYQFDCYHPFADRVEPEIRKAVHNVVDYFNFKYNVVGEEKHISQLASCSDCWQVMNQTEISFAKEAIGTENIFALTWEIIKNIFGFSKNTICILILALLDRQRNDFSKKYKQALYDRLEFENIFKEMLGTEGVFLYPTQPTAAVHHNQTLTSFFNMVFTGSVNILGMPSTAVPMGLNKEGLPIGVQVIANVNNDRLCLAVAEDLEKAFGGWKEPQKN